MADTPSMPATGTAPAITVPTTGTAPTPTASGSIEVPTMAQMGAKLAAALAAQPQSDAQGPVAAATAADVPAPGTPDPVAPPLPDVAAPPETTPQASADTAALVSLVSGLTANVQALTEQVAALKSSAVQAPTAQATPPPPAAPVDPITAAARSALGEYAPARMVTEYQGTLNTLSAWQPHLTNSDPKIAAQAKDITERAHARMAEIQENVQVHTELAKLRGDMDGVKSEPEIAAIVGRIPGALTPDNLRQDFPHVAKALELKVITAEQITQRLAPIVREHGKAWIQHGNVVMDELNGLYAGLASFSPPNPATPTPPNTPAKAPAATTTQVTLPAPAPLATASVINPAALVPPGAASTSTTKRTDYPTMQEMAEQLRTLSGGMN